jgi:UDP-N-acetylglucosamine diphosphorylase/glucosamine-1-phosphate N-acetyltransferase
VNKITQAIILAAGQSTRCHPLTLTRPKPLLKVANKTILEHNLLALEGLVDEAILVVGYKKEMIKDKIGNLFGKLKIRYAEQKEQDGTAHALLAAEKLLKDRFILLSGDDVFSHDDLKRCLEEKYSLLAAEVKDPEKYGVISRKKGFLDSIDEKPSQPKSNLINTSCYVLTRAIFPLLRKQAPSPRGEYELTDVVTTFSKTHQTKIIKAKRWLPNGYSWDLLDTNQILLDELEKSEIKGEIEQNVTIKGIIKVGEGTLIKSGSYIEGPVIIGRHCTIGPNSYIRGNTSIGDGCKVGQAVEIKNSILMDNSKVPHLSYVGDSIIGEHVNLGAGTIIANLKHDNLNIRSMIKGSLVDTGRRKLGTIIGDNVHTGIKTSIYPGRKIWPDKTTKPGEIVKEDIV